MEDVAAVGILTDGSEIVFGLDALSLADGDGGET